MTDSKINISVYDIAGREIAVLVNGFKTAGKHSVLFNASEFAGGIYFYRMITGDNRFLMTKKMALIR
jgi:hypothetical protein